MAAGKHDNLEKRNGQPSVVRDVPWAALIICITVLLVVVVVSGAYLVAHNVDLVEFRALLNTLLNIGQGILITVGVLYGGAAYRKANQAAEQTNGSLEDRIKKAAIAAYHEVNGND